MQTIIKSSSLTLAINDLGAEITSIKDNNQTEYIWQAGSEWKRHAPVLFPIVGKLKDNTYNFKDKSYHLTQHGFARDLAFNLISSNESSCVYQLKSSDETKENYPFDFRFTIKYMLLKNKVVISYSITNPSNEQLYFSVGAHPAFNCQLNGNDTLNDYYLEFDKSIFWLSELKEGLICEGNTKLELGEKKLVLSSELFNNDALVFKNNQINKLSLCSIIGHQKITLECKNWPFFGIWTKKNCDKFICLEPWYGITDSENSTGNFQEKKGIISLNPQTNFSCNYSITINSQHL
ncbi:MAG: aldose 1-epimerase family protein [Bacteroidota bacterium]|nr:aldose 1-epimerase family protein [Bacteroidota bacterium]